MKNTTIHKAIMLGGVSSLFAGAVWAGDVNLPITGETDVQGSLYAGGKLLSDETASYGTVSVDITGGSVSAGSGENVYWRDGVYGGASEFGNENTSFSADRVVINMSGGDMNNIVAGSFATEKGSVSIGSSEISISGGLVRNSVLGGSILTYDSNGTIKGHAVSETGSSRITVSGDAVIGETVSSAKQKSENNDVIFNSVYGGGYTAGSGTQILGSTSVAVSGGAVVNGVVVGGSHAGPTGSAYVGDKNAADFSSVVSSVSISENADIRGGYVFGGAYHSWGDGAKSSDIYGSTLVKVDGGRIFNSDENAGYVFGGGYSSDGNDASHGSISNVYGSANVEISGGSVTNVYGGAYVNEAFGYGSASGGVMGGTNISITGGEVANVYGGGLTERVTGTDGLSVSSFVKGGSKIVISGGASVGGDVYGGGNGADSSLEGGTTVVLKDGASVAGTIYGGGANGATVSGERTFVLGSSGGTHAAASPVKVSGFDKIKIFKSEAVLDGIVGTADANMQILRGYAGDSTSNIRLTNADYSGISGTFDVSSPVYGEGKPFATSLINFSDNSTFTVESSSFDGMSLSGAGAVIINGRVWSGISGSSTLNLKDVSFSGNTASNLKTADNAATGLQNGLVSASVVNIDNARFLNNVAESASGVEGEGTSLYSGLVGGGKISISNSEFSGNEARQVSSGASGHNIYGGIAYAGGGVSISVDSTRFLNNSSRASEGVSGGLITRFPEATCGYPARLSRAIRPMPKDTRRAAGRSQTTTAPW